MSHRAFEEQPTRLVGPQAAGETNVVRALELECRPGRDDPLNDDLVGAATLCLRVTLDHPDKVYDVTLTPDDQFALTACRDGFVRIWELTTGKLIAPPYRVRGRMATSVELTPDGTRAELGMNGTAMISLDLEARVTPDTRPLDELQRLCELVSGQQIDSGNLTRLTTDEWLNRWRTR